MALNGDVLGAAIQSAVDAAVTANPSSGTVQRAAIFKAIGDAIVSHITTNAQVVVTNVAGVTVGMGTSGPGTGTVV